MKTNNAPDIMFFAVFCGVQAQETYYEKHLIFPERLLLHRSWTWLHV